MSFDPNTFLVLAVVALFAPVITFFGGFFFRGSKFFASKGFQG